VEFDVELTQEAFRALTEGNHTVGIETAVFRVEGSGTISCLQGMLTCDVVKMPEHGLIWGAFLTPKGMIITDAWIRRDGAAAWVIVPRSATETMRQLFARTIPPRLAKVRDLTAEIGIHWLIGANAALPDTLDLALPTGPAPFRALLFAAREDAAMTDHLSEHGWRAAPAAWADAARLLSGWPALGREIDEKTLPQEVRFDELDGVRYDKGCYTGQETVARLHFRGHANRILRGLLWDEGSAPDDREIRHGEKSVGSLRTLGRLGHRVVGLAPIRREVEPGAIVLVGDTSATVIDLPTWGSGLQAG
jgi:folate-binding protein YgfZ